MKVLITFLFFLISISLSAQLKLVDKRTYAGFSVGGHLGSSYIEHRIYNFFLIPTYVPGINTGLHFRHFPDHKAGKLNTGFQVGLQYFQKGWGQEFQSEQIRGMVRETYLDYVVLPIDAIIYAGKPENRIYITLGFYGEYLIAFESSSEPEGISENEDFYTYDPTRDKKVGYGFKGGFGFQKEFNFGSIFIEGFFSYTLSSFIGVDSRSSFVPEFSQLYSVGLTTGYLFSL